MNRKLKDVIIQKEKRIIELENTISDLQSDISFKSAVIQLQRDEILILKNHAKKTDIE